MVSRRVEGKETISSSRIRKAVLEGDVAGAIPLLGYPFTRLCTDSMPGTWVDGVTPSSAFAIDPHLALPPDGVYAAVSGGSRNTLAAVTALDERAQLMVRDVQGQHELLVELITSVCSLDEYRANPNVWDLFAHTYLDQWQRPVFAAASGH
jgi:FAD synthase